MPLCIDIYPLTKGESLFTSVVIIVPNLGDCGNLELNSLEEFDQETIEEVEQELVDPKGAKMDETEYNTPFRKTKVAELAVKDSIKIFNSETVSDLDLNTYQSCLKDIGKELKLEEFLNLSMTSTQAVNWRGRSVLSR